jgi:rubrerythrin
MTKTVDDLKAAFAGESQANRRYLAYAKKADEEGHKQVARLFRAIAAAETIHAHNHMRTLGDIKSTAENLKAAAAGEHYEVNTMYPEFIGDAKNDGDTKAERSFTYAIEAEKGHEIFYNEALESLGKPTDDFDYYVCPVCGYTHARNAPDKCPVCNTAGSKFEKIS